MCEDKSMVSAKSALGQRKLQILENEISGSNSHTVVETTPKTNTRETSQPEANTIVQKEKESPPSPKADEW